MTLDTCNSESKFEVKWWKVKVTGNENVKIVFAHIFVKSGSICVRSRLKWFPVHSIHVVQYLSSAEVRHLALFACLSVAYLACLSLSFTQYWNAVESSYFMGILLHYNLYYCLKLTNRAPLFHLDWHSHSTPWILLRYCQLLGIVANCRGNSSASSKSSGSLSTLGLAGSIYTDRLSSAYYLLVIGKP